MAANRIPSPVTRGLVRMPMIMQYENLECGSVSLAMVLGYYGKWIAPGVVRAATGPCRDGGNAENIAKAARSYGLHADVEQISTEEFYAKATFPCIVHWEYNHFLVIRGVRGNNVYINDPKKGDYKVPKETFAGKFTGIVVFFRPEPDFQPEGHRKSLWEFILEHLEGSWGSLAFVLVTTMLISILTLANQGMSRIFLDRLIKGQNPEWTGPFIGLLTMIAVSMIVVTLIRDYYILRINGKLAISSNAAYMEKIFKLPISFFNQRLPGDINFRRMMMGEIASTLVQTFGPLLLQIVMMILYLIVMVNYSPILTMIGIASIVINAAMARIISRIRINITRRNMTNTGQATSTLSAGIQMIETIKASGAENGFFELWSGYQAGVVGASVEYARVDHVLGVIPIAVSTLSNHVVTMTGVFLIIHGQFTPGMLLAFQGILNIFQQP
ncbi:MAG: NHLP family bacteriocin export ABC transporter peptidase/permease/ATPase, partial [Butyrivibrio sp.]|nr:NHLP family bacteriocin export ABC transporter peptidase/permease/ATPase [Butyrivibrio sp.]